MSDVESRPNIGELGLLLATLAQWASVSGVTVYLYGSRARQDHRPDSDVDIHVRFGSGIDGSTAAWWSHENETDFAALKSRLPGRLEILEGPDSLKRAIEDAPVILQRANAVAISLPSKPF